MKVVPHKQFPGVLELTTWIGGRFYPLDSDTRLISITEHKILILQLRITYLIRTHHSDSIRINKLFQRHSSHCVPKAVS